MATPYIYDSTSTVANLDVVSFDKEFARRMPNGTAPLFALTSELTSMTIHNWSHGYFAKTMVFPKLTLTALVADGAATTFTVSSTAGIIPNMTFRVQSTGEIVMVTAIASPTSVTVRRGVGNIAAAAIANGVVLYQLSSAFEEASVRPQALRILPEAVINYTQIFRNTWLLSGTQANIDQIAGNSKVVEDKMDAMAFHAADIERALFFGQKYVGTYNNQAIHTMDGLESSIRQFAPSNIATAASTTTYDQLEALLDVCFNVATDPKSGNKRVLFVGATAFKVINAIGRKTGTYQIIDGQTSFGMQYSTFKISRGTFMMIEHPMFNSNADWSKMAFAVDLTTLQIAYLAGRKTRHDPINSMNGATVDNSLDAVGGTLLTEMTLLCRNPAANAIVYGLTAAA